MFDLIGKTVGPYRILEQVGEGGMATVYKAYQPSMDRYIAVKVLPVHLSKDLEFTKRFQREARAIARLEHAHILPVYDYGEYEGITYIAMRYIKAGTLKDRMSTGRLPLDEINNLISQIGGALDYAHRMGVIHRDIKPGNVLLDDQGDAYLSDFGLARMMEPSQQLTGSGVGLGTPSYMSPEQGQGIKVDHRSDIYSLGIILYEMLTGRVPYEAETPMAVVFKHIHGDLPLPHTINPNLPEPIERVVLKALAKNPTDRYQTAGEMVQALNFAVRMMNAEAQQQTVVEKVEPRQHDISIVKRLQSLWDQPRGKIMLTSGAVAVFLLLGFLLIQLPGNITILAPNATDLSTSVATTTQSVISASESSTYRKTVTVQADHGWEGTGVIIEAGQKIHLNYLSGVWRTASNYSWENGSNCNGTCVDCILTTAPETSLLVKVGGGDAACLGDATFSSPTTGLLYLSFNDCSGCFRDNEGSLTVEIEVSNNTQSSTPLAFSTQLLATPTAFVSSIDVDSLTSLPTPQGKLVFDENFDDGFAIGIGTASTRWEIVDDNNGGKLLQTNNSMGGDWVDIGLIVPAIADGTIEFKVNLVAYSISSGRVACNFRHTPQERYVLSLVADTSNIAINYQGIDDIWRSLDNAVTSYAFNKKTWYEIRIDFKGNEIIAYIDGKKVLTATDDRLRTGGISFTIAPTTVAQFDDIRVWAQP